MKLEYNGKNVRKHFEDFNFLYRTKGPDLAKAIKKRIDQLKSVKNFGDYFKTGLGKPHFLTGNLNERVGIRLTGNLRLIIKPALNNSDLNCINECETTIIEGVVDYHGQKEEWIIS